MIAKKATSTPLNSKSKMQNQKKGYWVQKQYLVFLVEREESRDIDVFLGLFWCIEERKKKMQTEAGQKRNFRKNVSSLVCGVPGAIYSPERENQGSSHSRATDPKWFLIQLILNLLDRGRVVLAEMNEPVIEQPMDETRDDVVVLDTPQNTTHEMSSTQVPRCSGRIVRPPIRFIGLGETYDTY